MRAHLFVHARWEAPGIGLFLQPETTFARIVNLCTLSVVYRPEDYEQMNANPKLPIAACHLIEAKELIEKANNLVNPNSGLANDFLNQYNEVLLLVENLPILLPEMVEELLAWNAKTYEEYFTSSPLPGGDVAIKIYHTLDREFRKKFETQISRINKLAGKAVIVISERNKDREELAAEDVELFCMQISKKLRAEIENASKFVNYGLAVAPETSQALADRLMQA